MRAAATLLVALGLAGAAGCAGNASRPPVAQAVDDARITAGVQAAMRDEPTLDVSDIKVETDRGVVQLSGFVSSAVSLATASTVARSVNGVKSVKNDIRLK